ncbi:MAG: sphingosine N-acyltransferase lag1 [Alectoria fallacina]|uniref:Sphingosine N-acyltransferase lag1 n=1 Tax=Alectoria fallacina TaxID=1903189 RepID=A0A8H3IQ92_9LECA|nr:MAG: sphingosine N-acyltransferase lag1 [Alectoria fallacina]
MTLVESLSNVPKQRIDQVQVISWSLILSVATIHSLVPLVRPYTTLFYELPYAQGNGQYVQGSKDALFVLGWLVLMTAIRATVIECLYEFVTRLRVMSRKASMRFAEQGFLLVYDFTSFSMGMNILVSSPYWLNFEELWSTWPSRELSGELKWYYLVQLAFWLQQLLAINLEKRRKDFGQMFLHHCVTSFLMYVAYAYRWTNVGNVILCIMDVVDFLLPLAKMLKYLHYEVACNTMFGIFLATWLVARHGIYVNLCWSIYRDVPRVMPFACYSGETMDLETDPEKLSRWRYFDPFFDQKGTICLDRNIKSIFLGLLLMLQVLSIVWFWMIIKVALSMLKGEGASDTRSGDEGEGEEDEEQETCEVRATGKPTQSANGKTLSSGSEAPPRQTGLFQRGGIRVPGSRDRKELIGRVGCNG